MEDRRLRKTDPLAALRQARPGQPAPEPTGELTVPRILEASKRPIYTRIAALVSAVPVAVSVVLTLLVSFAPDLAALMPPIVHVAVFLLAAPPLVALGWFLGWPRTGPLAVAFPASVTMGVILVVAGQLILTLWPTAAPVAQSFVVGVFCTGLTLLTHAVPLALGMAARDLLQKRSSTRDG